MRIPGRFEAGPRCTAVPLVDALRTERSRTPGLAKWLPALPEVNALNKMHSLCRHPRPMPEPGASPNPKDAVEAAANRAICTGRLTLTQVQAAMATDWIALGRQLGVGG